MSSVFLQVFIPLFVAMDVLGALPVFLSLTEGLSREIRRKIIIQAVSTSFFVGGIFIFFGQGIFRFLNITTADFKIAGGLLLLILSIRSIFDDTTSREHRIKENYEMIGIVPIAIPLIIGPAVLTTLLIMHDTYGLKWTVTGFLSNLLIVAVAFSWSEIVNKLLGRNAEQILSRVANIFLAAIAIMMMREGLEQILKGMAENLK